MNTKLSLVLHIAVSIICIILFIRNIISGQLYSMSSVLYILIIGINIFNIYIRIKYERNKTITK